MLPRGAETTQIRDKNPAERFRMVSALDFHPSRNGKNARILSKTAYVPRGHAPTISLLQTALDKARAPSHLGSTGTF